MTPEEIEHLESWLTTKTGAESVRVLNSTVLTGGAIQDNRLVEVAFEGGPWAGQQDLVLRMSNPGTVQASHDRAEEFALLKAAFSVGVRVPEPLLLCEEPRILGRPFFLMRRVSGLALGPKIVKDTSLGGNRVELVQQLGRELARIHTIKPGTGGLEFLGEPPQNPAHELVEQYRSWLDALGVIRPALEWGLRWLGTHAPEPGDIVLCHRDFRTGNYMVDAHGLTAILDWEFSGWGDPMEDIGWLCCRFWRFGADHLEAGGIATRAPFYEAYAAASGRPVDEDRVHYWEVMANMRWAVIALQQCARFNTGAESSLELALIGRRVPEMEFEIIQLTGG